MTDDRDHREPHLLFTAFEPSGDDHASGVIRELRARHPGLKISAWGGPKMGGAGAEIIERTGDAAVMGMPGLEKIREHRRINHRVDAWMGRHRPTMLIPVDSPAANFPICEIARAHGMSIVHLVAPQIWAWGSWRIRKLRRLTDRVLCLLPFEEKYFTERGVSATFVGHPLFDEPVDLAALDEAIAGWPEPGRSAPGKQESGRHGGSPKLALMPGSRPAEIEKNFPLQLDVFRRLAREHPEMTGMVACVRPEVEPELRRLARETSPEGAGDGDAGKDGWPERLGLVTGQADAVIRWCDLAVVVSGTVSLQVARQQKPMVLVYKSSQLMYTLIGRWILRTRLFTLPNLIAGRKIVPELVPHFGGPGPVIDAMLELIEHPSAANEQRTALGGLSSKFSGKHAVKNAADEIERVAGLERVGRSETPVPEDADAGGATAGVAPAAEA